MKKITSTIIAVFIGLVVVSVPVLTSVNAFAASGCVATNILGGKKCYYDKKDGNTLKEYTGQEKDEDGKEVETVSCSCDDGHGSSVIGILQTVINIMSIGIGILGVIGISIVGVQYLTAGGNEEQTRKAKRRLIEIVIGLVAYVLLYAILSWLLPNFNTDNSGSSNQTTSSIEQYEVKIIG